MATPPRMIVCWYVGLRRTRRRTPDDCATCDRDSNERGVIWNALYRESPEATASSCDQGLDAKRNPHRGRGEVFSLISPFIEPGNPSLSTCTLIRSIGDSENRRCGVHNESGQRLRRDFDENA